MTIETELTKLAGTKTAIRQAIEAKGVSVGSAPFADYPAKISSISGGSEPVEGWVRNSAWLTLPTVQATEQKFVGLHAVWPESNFCAFSASGAYTVDWGDGVTENFAAGVLAQHEYNYSNPTLAGTDGAGALPYKQAIVTVTPQAGQTLTALNLNRRHALTGLPRYNSGWLDIVISGPSITSLTISAFSNVVLFTALEQVSLLSNSVTSFNYMFYLCRALRSIPTLFVKDSGVIDMSNMFNLCEAIQGVPLFNTQAVTNMTGMFNSCTSLKSVPLFNTQAVTAMNFMFAECTSLKSVPLFNMQTVTNLSSMFSSCSTIQSVKLTNLQSAVNVSSMFSSCFSMQEVDLTLNSQLVPSTNSMFSNCTSLSRLKLSGLANSFSVTGCKLSANALNELYASLPTVSSATVVVTGNYGAASDDPTIATAKGWNVN